jgi:hypothetical protein
MYRKREEPERGTRGDREAPLTLLNIYLVCLFCVSESSRKKER